MKTILALVLATSLSYGQDFTASSGYHMTSDGALLGVSGATNLKTWNNRKVIVRAVGSYYSGSNWSTNTGVKASERFELGVASKNTMITGESLFNILELGYQVTQYRSQVGSSTDKATHSGLFFSVGLGTWLVEPVSVMLRYVTGYNNGVRFSVDIDF